MSFFRDLVSSVYNPDFYAGIPQKRFGACLGFFLLLAVILGGGKVVVFSPAWRDIPKAAKEITQGLINGIPADLQVSITKGKVSINKPSPYFIPYSNFEGVDAKQMPFDVPQNFIAIDATKDYNSELFAKYDAFILITRDAIYNRKTSGELTVLELSRVPDIKITRQYLSDLALKYSSWLPYLAPITAAGIFIAYFFAYSLSLVYFLILAILVLILAKAMKRELNFQNAYKISIFASVLPFIVAFVAETINPKSNLAAIAFGFTAIAFGVVLVNFLALNKTPAAPTSSSVVPPSKS